MNKEQFIKSYFEDLESLRSISSKMGINHNTLNYRATKKWGLTLRTKNESAIAAFAKGRNDKSGFNNGRFIDDGLDAKTRARVKSYGITPQDYLDMKESQGNKCKICNRATEKSLAIDHCHETGKVRGLLCNECNIGLGLFRDSTELLEKAIRYITTT